jgi:hypothetical protein
MSEWSAERELQVLSLFRQRECGAGFLASCRCPHDGRLLGAVLRLPDGIWAWQGGSRLAPAQGWDEFRSQFLDTFDQAQWSPVIWEEAAQYADEEIREWGRLGWDTTVMKILPGAGDEPIRVQDRQSPRSRAGMALTRLVTEERAHRRLAAALRCPDQPARVMIDDNHQEPASFAIRDLIDPDPGQPRQPVGLPGQLSHHPLDDALD